MADTTEINYGNYLKLHDLLSLQVARSSPVHPDELLFIVVHQASELWFKAMLHELDQLIDRMDGRDVLGAVASVKRVNALTRIVTQQLAALETLSPQRFAEFRGYLGTSSGSQSEQFRAIEAVSGQREPHFLQVLHDHGPLPPLVARALGRPTLEALFERLLAREGTTLDAVYLTGTATPLFMLAEGLLEYEQGFALWRFLHVQLVERIIGPLSAGTGGTLGAKYLQKTVSQRFFPALWAVRGRVFGGGPAGG